VVGFIDWIKDRGHDVFAVSSGAWTALAAWIAVAIAIAALLYARRRIRRAEQQSAELLQPNVAMYIEPNAKDWHLIELVVKNFGRTPAYGIRFEFVNPPTVPRYEIADHDGYVDIGPLNLPAEIPFLAPSQEWRTVWDSALDRKQLGDSIESRFHGAVTYFDRPADKGAKRKPKRQQYRTSAVLDWSTLHPVERLELLTTHDLARQEKQKLELLRGLLTYFYYVAKETREDVLRAEINRIGEAVEQTHDRWRERFAPPQDEVAPSDRAHDHDRAQKHDPDDDPDPETTVINPATAEINGKHRRDWV
jgi:hypothetical protein